MSQEQPQDNEFGAYQARHSAPEQGTEFAPGPTSPVSGPGGQAAARAAYEGAQKNRPDTAIPEEEHVVAPEPAEQTSEETVEQASEETAAEQPESDQAQAMDDSPEGLAAAFENETSEREQELIDQLQRVSASYTNLENEYHAYVRRSKRDLEEAAQRGTSKVLEGLLPVLDEIGLARAHGDLETGPLAKIAEKLETSLFKQGVERFGAEGDVFDPTVHQAISHDVRELPEGVTDTTVVQVMQPGYRIGDRVVRPAIVGVADPK
ncbi:HSP-70 cofactor [Dermatophilus congolensis]|uniref:Protein GrpE n=1 Tax=Dermatophilus congolensis TaxID=1863 RepID=A0AA46BP59_9MICO|nr:nucleotide exchange factor GrpE [Dermatophilus congolensis]STD12326.1 HSP-70 cofactor [Dermatophilus congolensis]